VKKVLYIDMDGVLVDFASGLRRTPAAVQEEFKDHPDDISGIFAKMDPVPGAVLAFTALTELFDVYILSTAPWDNPSAWRDKLEWVKKFLGEAAYKRLILTHHKELMRGEFLIDDRDDKNGVDGFEGEHLHFGSDRFPDWVAVLEYLEERV